MSDLVGNPEDSVSHEEAHSQKACTLASVPSKDSDQNLGCPLSLGRIAKDDPRPCLCVFVFGGVGDATKLNCDTAFS